MWRLFSSVKQVLDYFVRLTNVHCMDTNALIMLNKALESLAAIVGLNQSLDFGFGGVVARDKVNQKGVHLNSINGVGITFEWSHRHVIV